MFPQLGRERAGVLVKKYCSLGPSSAPLSENVWGRRLVVHLCYGGPKRFLPGKFGKLIQQQPQINVTSAVLKLVCIKMGLGLACCKFKFLDLEHAFLIFTPVILMQIVLKVIRAAFGEHKCFRRSTELQFLSLRYIILQGYPLLLGA